MTHDIETQLLALRPTGQTSLARKILAIPHRRRQRRRDLFVGLTGLLTGIAATVLVMLSLPAEKIEVPVVQYVVVNAVPDNEPDTVVSAKAETPAKEEYVHVSRLTGYAEPIDLDAWIARYEKLLRHRPAVAYQLVVFAPVSMPGGVSPLEYRNKLLAEFGG
jgi:hypothetical protein